MAAYLLVGALAVSRRTTADPSLRFRMTGSFVSWASKRLIGDYALQGLKGETLRGTRLFVEGMERTIKGGDGLTYPGLGEGQVEAFEER